MQTLLATVEEGLRYEGYEVVEFERIKGDLVTLLKGDDSTDDLYSSDELVRFKANLALRNIDSRFENGKRILADYADLVFGVTINSLEVVSNRVNVRVTLDATFFSQGEWMKLASKFDIHIAAGINERAEDLLYNSSVIIGPKGHVGTFRKVHLWNEENLFFKLSNNINVNISANKVKFS